MNSVSKNNIYFRSKIRPTSITDFYNAAGDAYYNSSVNQPWTYKETIKSNKALTTDIYDCTAGGIVDIETGKVTLFHICPENKYNKDFDCIEKNIIGLSGLKNNLRGFIIGSQSRFADSKLIYEKLKYMMTKNGIPVSELREAKDNRTAIMYDSKNDEWLITNDEINNKIHNGEKNSEKILKTSFKEVNIDTGDEIA